MLVAVQAGRGGRDAQLHTLRTEHLGWREATGAEQGLISLAAPESQPPLSVHSPLCIQGHLAVVLCEDSTPRGHRFGTSDQLSELYPLARKIQ